MSSEIRLIPFAGISEISPGDDLGLELTRAASKISLEIFDGDIVIVAQKIVSKSEGRLVNLELVTPSQLAIEIADKQRRDPRLAEVILNESACVIRSDERVLITETRHGFVCANAGVDRSNVPGDDWVSLLPIEPDLSARRLKQRLAEILSVKVAVIITDSFGRAWREGLTNVAIGVAGLEPLLDFRGQTDGYGKELSATTLAVADEIAAASGLLMGKTARIPVVLMRGYSFDPAEGSARDLIRPKERDLFR